MGADFDRVKGHAKEALGDVTGNEELERDGKTDRVAGEVKEKVDEARDRVKDVIDAVKEKVHRD